MVPRWFWRTVASMGDSLPHDVELEGVHAGKHVSDREAGARVAHPECEGGVRDAVVEKSMELGIVPGKCEW